MRKLVEILVFLPVVGAIIGYVSKWTAIQMLFRPERWVGLGPLGWQGVVQRRAPKFAAGVADTIAHTGVRVEALVGRVDPADVAAALGPVIDELGLFPYQGLFPARQEEIAREYAHLLEREVLSPRDLLQHAWDQGGPRLVKTAFGTIERELDALLPTLALALGAPVDAAARARAVAALTAGIEAALPSVLPRFERYLEERLGIAATIEAALQAMPKSEFEAVLRGVFEEDEWILVTLGGALGGAIGLVQAAVVQLFS